ncbi:hypothetical protein HGA64_04545 [Candidatus Falkowbacteria bacterium]|nr:hypothetical protein [Candidatus Falkowbacteria bacterium]
MSLIQTSHDVLNLTLAFCALLLSALIAWFIYYMVMVVREMFKAVHGVNEKIEKAGAVIDSLKEKIEHSTSYLLLIGEGVKKLVEVMSKAKAKKKSK